MIGVAVIGLGAAPGPHARSLLELKDRVRVVHAVARGPQPRRRAEAEYGFPAMGDAIANLAVGAGTGSGWMAFSHEPHKAVIADWLDAIEEGRDPAIPGEEALATQRVIDDTINKGV